TVISEARDERRHAGGVVLVDRPEGRAQHALLDAYLEREADGETGGEARGGERWMREERPRREQEHAQVERMADPRGRPVGEQCVRERELGHGGGAHANAGFPRWQLRS